MKMTNKHGILPALVSCVAHDPYDKGDADYSVTQLLEPARKSALTKRHGDKLTVDAADRIYAFIGKIGHTILERAKHTGDVSEHRVSASVAGFRISGQFDRLVEGDILIDLKIMSVWEIIFGLKDEKVWQLNMYRWLAEQNGYRIKRLIIVGILRDWSIGEVERRRRAGDGTYPQHQVVQIDVPMKPLDEVLEFMKLRISAHERALNTPNWLPECTADERWAKPTTYALMKEGRKSALRVMEDIDELREWAVANNFADWQGDTATVENWQARKNVFIETRPGESIRCARYCDALQVCTQGQQLTQETETAHVAKTDAA